MWRMMIRGPLAPIARDASTKSFSRSESIWARVCRASVSQLVRMIAMNRFSSPRPSTPIIRIASSSCGMA